MPTNYTVVSHVQKVTAADTADVQTFTLPLNAHAFEIACTGQDVFVTFDGTTPSASNGLKLVKDQLPQFHGFASKPTIKVAPTAAVAATVNVLWLS
jgi:hypothetical protein